MTNYIIRRSIQSILLLFLISVLIYAILNLVPGGPFDLLKVSNPRMAPAQILRLNAMLDLDKPLFPGKYCPPQLGATVEPCRFDEGRYLHWLGRVFSGDWGTSWTMSTGTPVLTMIGNRVWYTLLLMTLVEFFAVLIAVPIGIISAVKQYSFLDYLVTTIAFFGQSMPTFWTGLMAMSIFAVTLNLFPTGGVSMPGSNGDIIGALARILTFGRLHPELAGFEGQAILDGLHHVALPAMVLIFFNLAGWSRYTRSSMLEVLRQDYIRTARSKGLREQVVIIKHGLRNALIPLITILALTIPGLFAGALITESIYSWPGMGRMLIDAISNVDWPVVQGVLVITSVIVVFSNFAGDLLYAVVDPRIQYS